MTINVFVLFQNYTVWHRAIFNARFPIVCQSHKPCCGSLPTRLVVGNIATTHLVGIPATASLVGKPATTMLVGTCYTADLACSHKLCVNTIVVGTCSLDKYAICESAVIYSLCDVIVIIHTQKLPHWAVSAPADWRILLWLLLCRGCGVDLLNMIEKELNKREEVLLLWLCLTILFSPVRLLWR